MKWILNLFPRPWLILLSIWFRPLIKWFYRGTRFVDPIDGQFFDNITPINGKVLCKIARSN